MGSQNYGCHDQLGTGNGRLGLSKRSGKKCSSKSDKPKQPQRGLGVAQLEKIRLQNQMMAGYLHSSPIFHCDLNKENPTARKMANPSSPSSSSSTCSSPHLAVHPHIMMGFTEYNVPEIRYDESQASRSSRSLHSPNVLDLQHQSYIRPNMTMQFLEQNMEMQENGQHDHRCYLFGSNIIQYSDSSNSQELDLELKL